MLKTQATSMRRREYDLDLRKPRYRQRTAPCRTRHFEYLDEDVSHARLSVAGISLTRHDSNGLAVHLVMV